MSEEKEWRERVEKKMDVLADAVTKLALQEAKLTHAVDRIDRFEERFDGVLEDIYGREGIMVKVSSNILILGGIVAFGAIVLSAFVSALISWLVK